MSFIKRNLKSIPAIVAFIAAIVTILWGVSELIKEDSASGIEAINTQEDHSLSVKSSQGNDFGTVRVFLPATYSNARILIDGKIPLIESRTPSMVTLRVNGRNVPHTLDILSDGKVIASTQFSILSDEPVNLTPIAY